MVVVVRVVMQLLPHLVVLVEVHLLAVLVICLVVLEILHPLHHHRVTMEAQVVLILETTTQVAVEVQVQ
jgi:hypothetical protein